MSGELDQLRARKEKLEHELRNLAATAAETGPSAFLVEQISARERELRETADRLVSNGSDSPRHIFPSCENLCTHCESTNVLRRSNGPLLCVCPPEVGTPCWLTSIIFGMTFEFSGASRSGSSHTSWHS